MSTVWEDSVLKYFIKYCVVAFVLFGSFTAQADIKKLSLEFLGRNFQIHQSQMQIELSKLRFELDDANRQWAANLSGSYQDDSLDGLTFFSVVGTKTKIYSASIEKPFIWGGQFKFENTYENYSGGNFFITPTYGFNQKVSYSQNFGANFLGRQSYLLKSILKDEVRASELNNEKVTEERFLQFVLKYVETALAKSNLRLAKEALLRSQLRLNLIRRWTKDGIREKVDLYRAELAELQSMEGVHQEEMNFQASLKELSVNVHRKILPIDISVLRKDIFERPQGNHESNKTLELLKNESMILEKKLKQAKMTLLPSVNFSSSYETNAYDNTGSNSLSDGTLNGDNKAVAVALNVSVPIGFESQTVQKQQANIQKMLKEKELSVFKQNFTYSQLSLVKQFEMNEENIKLSRKRLKIAKKALDEFNRLYSKGKASLENVIRAEEDLISTERSYVNYLAVNKRIVFSLAQLYGSLKEYLFTQYEEQREQGEVR